MKKALVACVLVLAPATVVHAQDAAAKPVQIESFKAGDTPIAIPPPLPEMSEVGYDNREFMEVFVAPTNRLIAGFVLTSALPTLRQGTDITLSKYAMVQVPRRGEYMDCKESDFKEVTAGFKEQFGDAMNSSIKEAEAEFNRRMKSLDLKEATVSMGAPIQLGCLFSEPDAYGFGMVMPVEMGGHTTKTGMGGALVRVKQRLLFVYLYSEYKDEETVKWLRKATEDWADAILKANK